MLSLVIPYFKLKYFEATLHSLASQSNKQFKVYIGDDNSPESPLLLIEKYQDTLDLVYQKFETNLGGISLVQQWKRCVDLVQEASWIMVLGDDDCLSTNAVAAFYKSISTINQNHLKVVRYSSQTIGENGEELSRVFCHEEFETANNFFYRRNKGLTRSSLSEYVFNLNLLRKNFFYDFPLAWHSDDLAVLECSNFGTIYTINEAKVFVRISTVSISGRADLDAEKLKASKEYYNRLLHIYSKKFNKQNLQFLFKNVECFFYSKKTLAEYLKLCYLHLNYLGFISFLKFHRRIVKNRNAS